MSECRGWPQVPEEWQAPVADTRCAVGAKAAARAGPTLGTRITVGALVVHTYCFGPWILPQFHDHGGQGERSDQGHAGAQLEGPATGMQSV